MTPHMRLGVVSLLAILASAGAASAGPERTQRLPYQAGAGLDSPVAAYAFVAAPGVGGVMGSSLTSDRRVSVSVRDATGLPIAGVVFQRVGGIYKQELGSFCGSTRKPLKLARPGEIVEVVLQASTSCSEASIPTTGYVTMQLSR